MNKVVLITGTSTGLGLALAVDLAQQNYTEYATMRNLDKQGDLLAALSKVGASAEICALDVTNTQSVNSCVETILAKEGRIDVLVNNAGAGFARATEQATEEEIQWVMDLNFHGVVRCCKAVIPSMREARSGHIINITSVGGLVGQPFNELYCAAKFAVEGYTEAMASYMNPTFDLKFTAVEPGGISTEFMNSALAQLASTGGMLEDAYLPVLQQYVGAAQARAGREGESAYQSAEEVAKVVIDCIEQASPPIRVRTSEWAEELCRLKTQADPTGLLLQQYVVERFLQTE